MQKKRWLWWGRWEPIQNVNEWMKMMHSIITISATGAVVFVIKIVDQIIQVNWDFFVTKFVSGSLVNDFQIGFSNNFGNVNWITSDFRGHFLNLVRIVFVVKTAESFGASVHDSLTHVFSLSTEPFTDLKVSVKLLHVRPFVPWIG